MERLDKIISTYTDLSRKDAKEKIKKGLVKVGEKIERDPNKKFEETEKFYLENKEINVKKYIYLILNKPAGYVSARIDKNDKTVLDLIPDEYKILDIFPVGRLDKDTTGLMILTNNGEMSHNILSPNKHVKKKYIVTIDLDVTDEMKKMFKNGIELNDGKCKEAELEILDKKVASVVLTEGRYHQVKRMFGVCKAKVLKLHRVSMGNLNLPIDLKEGEFRELTHDEILLLQELK